MGASGFEPWPEDHFFLWLTLMIILTHSMQMWNAILRLIIGVFYLLS
jgi:hypothetical protein